MPTNDKARPIADNDTFNVIDTSGQQYTYKYEAAKNKQTKTIQFSNPKNITADYTIQEDDSVLLIDTTNGDVTITLPKSSSFSEGIWRHFILNHIKGANSVLIESDATESFVFGNQNFDLGSQFFSFTLGTLNTGTLSSWGIVRNITIYAEAELSSPWNATNFTTDTVIPFDGETGNNNIELLEFDSGGAGSYTVLTDGIYKIGYSIDIDSTGGSTWNLTAGIYVNDNLVAGTEHTTGNYGGEDNTLIQPHKNITLSSGDIVQVKVSQNNLTGSITYATFPIEIRL